MAGMGVRYIVIALGSPEDPATDEDVDTVMEVVTPRVPFKCTKLSEHVSNRLTWALIEELRS